MGSWQPPPSPPPPFGRGAPIESPDAAPPTPDADPGKPSRKRRAVIATLLAVALVAGGFQLGRAAVRVEDDPSVEADFSAEGETIPPSSTAELVEAVLPSVVNIQVTSVGFDPFSGTQTSEGQGSGVVIDRSGIILTNNHVVAGATEVKVVFTDGSRDPLEGRVLGTDPQRDLAVIKVDADDLSAVAIGTSEDLRLGDKVVAIGFPLGLGGPTVTQGIVSGIDRTIQARSGEVFEELSGMLQTDAAINPGNSGGPLVDTRGRLVGINTAAAQAAAAENVGFAIPVDEAAPIAEQIVNEPASERAWLGVQVASVTSSAEAAQLNLPSETRGALISGFLPGGAAEDAGLELGDVVTAVEGEEIDSAADLTDALADHEPGDEVGVRVLSSDAERTVEVELKERPATF